MADNVDLVKNTTQRVGAKALSAMENHFEYDDFGQPSHAKDGAYPLRANYEEGYSPSINDSADVAFRIGRTRTNTSRASSNVVGRILSPSAKEAYSFDGRNSTRRCERRQHRAVGVNTER